MRASSKSGRTGVCGALGFLLLVLSTGASAQEAAPTGAPSAPSAPVAPAASVPLPPAIPWTMPVVPAGGPTGVSWGAVVPPPDTLTVVMETDLDEPLVLYQHSEAPGRPEKQVVCTGRCGVLVDAGLPRRFSVELDGEAVGDPFVLAGLGPAARLRVQEVPRPSNARKWAGGALIFGALAAITVGALTIDVGVQDSRKASSFIIDADILIGMAVMVGGGGMLGAGIPVLVSGFRRTEPVVEVGVTGAFSPRFRGVALAPPLSFGGATLPATLSASWSF